VLYLHVGPPKVPPAKALERPEGHTVEYDDHGAVIGLELMGVRGMLDRNEELQLTWPPAHLAASALRQALAALASRSQLRKQRREVGKMSVRRESGWSRASLKTGPKR
jgi:hypothetical protein